MSAHEESLGCTEPDSALSEHTRGLDQDAESVSKIAANRDLKFCRTERIAQNRLRPVSSRWVKALGVLGIKALLVSTVRTADLSAQLHKSVERGT